MASKIFISYRRGDDPGFVQALFGRLEQAFSPEQIFMDVDNIEPGLDFVQVLNEQVGECDVLISVIGKGWIDARDEKGARRLDNPSDFVRLEIESALRQGKRVIPVLVGHAQMPHPEELPETLKPLATRHAVRLTHERFRSDAQGLIAAMQRALARALEVRAAQAEVDQFEQQGRQLEAEMESLARRMTEQRQHPELVAEPRGSKYIVGTDENAQLIAQAEKEGQQIPVGANVPQREQLGEFAVGPLARNKKKREPRSPWRSALLVGVLIVTLLIVTMNWLLHSAPISAR